MIGRGSRIAEKKSHFNILDFGDNCKDDYHPESSNIIRKDGSIEIYPIDGDGVETSEPLVTDIVVTELSWLNQS